jgi:response regulator RpfG family c-di-GMP phosphodiesterase
MDKDLISFLYVGDKENEDLKSLFSKDSGFAAHFSNNARMGAQKAANKLPDIILIDDPLTRLLDPVSILSAKKNINAFGDVQFRFKPAFFLMVEKFPEFDMRMELHDYGYDEFIVYPMSAKELSYKAGIFLEKKNLEQKQISREKTLKKAFHYLDEFKQELKTVKKELVQEKNSLNNALKQILHMTRERGQMKKSLAIIKENSGRNMDGFVGLLSTLIQTKVETNRGHGDRVVHIACFIAKQFDFDEKKLDDLRKAAMLHEIGLLFMSDQALKKEKKDLTNYEKNIWVQYPVKGADLLSDCQGLEGCAGIIRFLNENSDGTGFPDGLKRRYTPLSSRILAGADAFDMLKDNQDIHSLEDLLIELESIAGSRLDPVIVGLLEKYAVLHIGSDAYRVRGVGVEQLEPGMMLGTALFTSTGTKLFSVNTLLAQESIDKIIQYHREYPVDEIIYIKA